MICCMRMSDLYHAACTATRVRYLVAGEQGRLEELGNSSMGITLVDRLVQDSVFCDLSSGLEAARGERCLSLVKIS